MKKYLLIVLLRAIPSILFGQVTNNCDSLSNTYKIAERIALNRLGICTIYFTDGTLIKNCAIKAIKPFWIVYQKNRVLHDAMIEKIDCIIPLNENFVLWFTEKKEPIISKECHITDK